MPSYIITFKPNTPESKKQKVKDEIIAAGGTVGDDFTLINGFSCTMPETQVGIFAGDPEVEHIEADGKVTTQT